MAITLTLAGAFLGGGIGRTPVGLIYPPLAMFLAIAWSQNDLRIRDLAGYIRDRIEGVMPGLGAETFIQTKRLETAGMRPWRLVVVAHGGVFLVPQIMALGIALSESRIFGTLEWTLAGFDIFACLVVVWVMLASARKASR